MKRWLHSLPQPRERPPEVIVLLCCQSAGIGQVLLDAGAQSVVCTRGQLPDRVATLFSTTFWASLADPDTSVEQSFHRALVALRAQGEGASCDSGLLVLLPEDAEVRRQRSASELTQSSSSQHQRLRQPNLRRCSRSSLERADFATETEDFLGRELLLCQVLSHFEGRGVKNSKRVVCVHGEAGIGKTAFLRFLARFAHTPGRLFNDGVLYNAEWAESKPWLWKQAALDLTADDDSHWDPLRVHEDHAGGDEVEEQEYETVDRLCNLLQRAKAKRWLLIVDTNGGVKGKALSSLERSLGTLLEKTHVCVLLASRRPWDRDIRGRAGGFMVRNLHIEPLDGRNSAKLFLRRVRRPLCRRDFEMGPTEAHADDDTKVPGSASPSAGASSAPLSDDEKQAHAAALEQHPLLSALNGHPGRIREAAARVTPSLSTLHKLLKDFGAELPAAEPVGEQGALKT